MIRQYPGAFADTSCYSLVQLMNAWMERGQGPQLDCPATFLISRDRDGDVRDAVLEGLRACVECIGSAAPEAQRLYPETIALTVLGTGDEICWHADNCRLDEQGVWVRNAYPQRCLSAVLYLNQDFEGGEIVFDRQGLTIKPRTGLLIAFPSGHQYPHRVKMVSSGRRYALGLWFTAHRWHALLAESIAVQLHLE